MKTHLYHFKVLPALVGSGWIGLHVAVDRYFVPASLADSGEICLSADAVTGEEFESYIDELIVELEELKKVGRRKLKKLSKS